MSTSRLPVVAAIPNYNMAGSLDELLPIVAQQGYAEIFVLDDASTDHSRDVVHDFDSSVKFVTGETNVGAGANRNRIIGALAYDALIHFIDADTHPETERAAEVAQDLASGENTGFVGGLVKEDGKQHPFNYGPRQSLHAYIGSVIQARIYFQMATDRERAVALRKRCHGLVENFPDPFAPPKARPVFWTLESNLVVPSKVFKAMDGFDPSLRDSEIQDLAIRLSKTPLSQRFDPLLSMTHKAVVVRAGNRGLQHAKAELDIARKHGLRTLLRTPRRS